MEVVSTKSISDTFGEMCEVSCVGTSVGVKWGGEQARRRKLF